MIEKLKETGREKNEFMDIKFIGAWSGSKVVETLDTHGENLDVIPRTSTATPTNFNFIF